MKKLFLLTCLMLALAFAGRVFHHGFVQAQGNTGDRIFNVRAFGALGNCTAAGSLGSCTNDVVAIRRAVAAANANGGGIVYFPQTATGAYYQLLGTAGSDSNLTTIDSNHFAIWNITSNNVTFRFAPGVTIRTVSSYLYQTNSGGGTIPGQEFLFYFGNGTTIIENFRLEGTWSTFSFELASPAAYFTGDNSANGFLWVSGKQKRSKWMQCYVTGFPQGGLLDGYTSGSDQLTDSIYEDIRVLEYGSGGDDLWFYTYGGTTFSRCWFITSRKSSHGIYFGATKPRIKILECYFHGQDESAHLENKFGIQMYQTAGSDPIRDVLVQDCTFDDVRNPIWIEHVGGYNTRNIKILGNYFLRSGGTPTGTGIQMQQSTGCEVGGNWFQGLLTGISLLSSGAGNYNDYHDNQYYDCNTGLNLNTSYSTVTNEHYERSSITANGSSRFIITGAYNVVDGLVIIDGGSSAGSPVGLIVNGAGNRVVNTVTRATASQTYSIIHQIISTRGYYGHNYIDHTGSGYTDISGDEITVEGNQTNKLMTIAGTGSAYSKATANLQVASAQMRLTGLVIPTSNIITGGWETITGAYAGSGNWVSGTDLDHDSAAFAASYTPHMGIHRAATKTVTSNVTINAPTNPVKGQTFTFHWIEDGTGGRTFTYNAVYKKSCTETTTASTRTTITFMYDGTNMVQVGACLTGF